MGTAKFLLLFFLAFAQEGHPLKGAWLGDWGPDAKDRNRVVIHFDWDGKNLTGIVNPGPDAAPIQKASLDVKEWIVRFEVDAKDRTGKVVRYVVEGKFENMILPNRTLVGTWNHDNVKGDFRLRRR
jgi:hypothetical protein